MRRVQALGVALIALIAAGFLWTRDRPVASAAPLPVTVRPASTPEAPLEAPVSTTGPADREARRFNRYDKDRDDRITRDEYLAARKKAFAKLDADKDGKLGFEEFATATAKKFATADIDKDATLAAAEFATTAARRRRPGPAATPCACD